MDYDVTDFLGNLFGGAVATVTAAPEPMPRPALADTVTDSLIGTPFADWVRRPDFRGRMGWEAPNCPSLTDGGPGVTSSTCPRCPRDSRLARYRNRPPGLRPVALLAGRSIC